MVCKESDVEFFADESDSDSEDTEITEAVSIIFVCVVHYSR